MCSYSDFDTFIVSQDFLMVRASLSSMVFLVDY